MSLEVYKCVLNLITDELGQSFLLDSIGATGPPTTTIYDHLPPAEDELTSGTCDVNKSEVVADLLFSTVDQRSGQDEKGLQLRQPPSRTDPLSSIARYVGSRFFGLFQPQFYPYQQYAPGPPGIIDQI